MKNIPYSFEDLSCANDICDDFSLYPESFWLWAGKVKAWFKAFYNLVRKYWIGGLSWQLSIKGVFQTLRARPKSSIFSLVASFYDDIKCTNKLPDAEKIEEICTKQQVARFPNFSTYDDDNDQTIKNRSAKHKRRNRVMRNTGFWFSFSQ